MGAVLLNHVLANIKLYTLFFFYFFFLGGGGDLINSKTAMFNTIREYV